jgi:hypothetical protein
MMIHHVYGRTRGPAARPPRPAASLVPSWLVTARYLLLVTIGNYYRQLLLVIIIDNY